MTKLKELTAMMVNEIELFETAVEKLEKIQRQKITINSTNLESRMKEHQEHLRRDLLTHKQEMKSLGYALGKAKAYPTWALIIFVVSLILNGILIYLLLAGMF